MIYTRHLGAAQDDTKKDFDAALIRTHALTLATEVLRETQVDLAHVDRIATIGRLTASQGVTSLNSSSRFASDGNSDSSVWEDGERVFCRTWREATTATAAPCWPSCPPRSIPAAFASIALSTSTT